MPDTPYGETVSVQELCEFANVQRPAESPDLPGTAELMPALDTRPFPVFIRVIEVPAEFETYTTTEGGQGLRLIKEAQVRTYVLDPDDIEVADNAVWLIVGDAPTHTEPYQIDPA